MREIKFRGQRVDTKQWVYGNLIECGATGKKYIFPCGSDANESDKVGYDGCLMLVTFEVIEETVGQFTGLHDKNGTEIYDGDIMEIPYNGLKNTVVKYVENELRYNISFYNLDLIFRIGNIHENPELLERR